MIFGSRCIYRWWDFDRTSLKSMRIICRFLHAGISYIFLMLYKLYTLLEIVRESVNQIPVSYSIFEILNIILSFDI